MSTNLLTSVHVLTGKGKKAAKCLQTMTDNQRESERFCMDKMYFKISVVVSVLGSFCWFFLSNYIVFLMYVYTPNYFLFT